MKAKKDGASENEFEEEDFDSRDNKKKKIKRYIQIGFIAIGVVVMFVLIFSGDDKASDKTKGLSKAQSNIPILSADSSKEPSPASTDINLKDQVKGVVAEKPKETKAFDVDPVTKLSDVPIISTPVLPDLPQFKYDEPKKDVKKEDLLPPIPLPDLKSENKEIPPSIVAPDVSGKSKVLENPDAVIQKKRDLNMFVIGSGNDSGGQSSVSSSSKKDTKGDKDFIIYDKSKLVEHSDDSKSSNAQVTTVTNLENKILQGKMFDVVLETAINSQLPGTVRGIVSRDVFAESGAKILIPKGTRLYGTYSSTVTRGQSRLAIAWNRVIRPDGVSVAMTAQASDQFGRAGIEADVDNRYSEIFGNSLLLSFANIGAAIALEKLTGSSTGATQTVNSNGSVTTSNINPVNLAAQSVIQNTRTIANNLTAGSTNVSPIVTLPQGTKIKVIVNQDITVPDYIKERL